jgi:hypothetical protein
MCTGAEALIISGLMTGAGTAANISAGRKQRKASEQAASMELARKQKINEQAEQLFQSEVGKSDATDAQAAADAAAAEQLAQAQALTAREGTGFTSAEEVPGLAQSGSTVVKEAAARSLGDELQKAESQMKARSVMQGYAQRQRQRATQFGRAAERMGMLGNFGQGWGQVGQIDQQMAKFAGQNQAMLGDALTGLGSLGFQAYGAGMWGNAPAASTIGNYELTGKLGEQAGAAPYLGSAKFGAAPAAKPQIGNYLNYTW